MRDGLDRQVVDPRQALRSADGEARQLTAVARRKRLVRGADLFFDQIEIVEQPFPGWRNALPRGDGDGEQAAGIEQCFLGAVQTQQQTVVLASEAQNVCSRQDLAMGGHLLAVQQLAIGRRRYREHGARLAQQPSANLAAGHSEPENNAGHGWTGETHQAWGGRSWRYGVETFAVQVTVRWAPDLPGVRFLVGMTAHIAAFGSGKPFVRRDIGRFD